MKVLTKIFAAIMVVAVCSACLCSCNDDDEDENAVKFRYDLFDEPCTQWGALEKKVKSFYESYYSLNTYPELSYYGNKREHLHICAFEEGMLVKTSVIVKAREVRIAEVEGFVIEAVEDGSIAVERVKDNGENYDIVLMDIQMPIMNGYDATRAIREFNKDIPIVAMTANAFEEDKRLALEAGMNEHVAKPIDVKKLKETINRFIK